jgi:hypothetical protein
MSEDKSKDYVPGVCNINREEIAKRRKIGHLGLGVLVVLLILFIYLDANITFRLLLFLPAMLASSGYLQAREKFCVGYAGAGKQNATEGSTEATNVIVKEALAADKRKARRMNWEAFAIAILVTFIIIAIPWR